MNKNSLFKKFKQNELTNLHFCTGGERSATTCNPEQNNGCSHDSVKLSQTQVPGQPEGTTMMDRTDFQLECLRTTHDNDGIATSSLSLGFIPCS